MNLLCRSINRHSTKAHPLSLFFRAQTQFKFLIGHSFRLSPPPPLASFFGFFFLQETHFSVLIHHIVHTFLRLLHSLIQSFFREVRMEKTPSSNDSKNNAPKKRADVSYSLSIYRIERLICKYPDSSQKIEMSSPSNDTTPIAGRNAVRNSTVNKSDKPF